MAKRPARAARTARAIGDEKNRERQLVYRTRARLTKAACLAALSATSLAQAQAGCRAALTWTPGQKEPEL